MRGAVPFWSQKGTEKTSGGTQTHFVSVKRVRGICHDVRDSEIPPEPPGVALISKKKKLTKLAIIGEK